MVMEASGPRLRWKNRKLAGNGLEPSAQGST